MNRKFNIENRAPLSHVMNAVRRHAASLGANACDRTLNRELIEIMHQHNWRKADFMSAKCRYDREQQRLRLAAPKRTVSCFKR